MRADYAESRDLEAPFAVARQLGRTAQAARLRSAGLCQLTFSRTAERQQLSSSRAAGSPLHNDDHWTTHLYQGPVQLVVKNRLWRLLPVLALLGANGDRGDVVIA